MTRLLLILALVGCGSDKAGTAQGSGSAGSGSARSTSDEFLMKPSYAIESVGVPDDRGWKQAAEMATRAWAESLNKVAASATVTPLKAPDGAVAPYLVHLVAKDKAGKVVFDGVALISRGRMINGSGERALERHLPTIGFPTTQLSLGHLLEMVYATAAVERSWFRPPSKAGWTYDGPHAPTLSYDQGGALLTLYRDKAGTLERLEVRFDRGGQMTSAAARKTDASWEPFTP